MMPLFEPFGPTSRMTDPDTSRQAATTVEAANMTLVTAIRRQLWLYGPQTAFEIADAICRLFGDRWQPDTVRTACARAGLRKSYARGLTPGGRPCVMYVLEADVTADIGTV